METVLLFILFITSTILIGFAWYLIGRASIYRKLMNDCGICIEVIGEYRALITAYEMKCKKNEDQKSEK